MQIVYSPKDQTQELRWVTQASKSKNWKAKILKVVFAETIYECWKYRNYKAFSNSVNN